MSSQDDVYSCGECGSALMWLRRNGEVTCSECETTKDRYRWTFEKGNAAAVAHMEGGPEMASQDDEDGWGPIEPVKMMPWYHLLLHTLAHWLGWNGGRTVTRLDEDGNVWVAFRCSGCGKISHRSIAVRPSPLRS